MKAQDFVAIICRFFAIYFFYKFIIESLGASAITILTILEYFQDYTLFQSIGMIILVTIKPIMMLIFSASFWFKADEISALILGRKKEETIIISSPADDIEKAGYAVLGMFVFATSLPEMINVLQIYLSFSPNTSQSIFDILRVSAIIPSLIFAFILIFGAGFIQKFFKKIRSW